MCSIQIRWVLAPFLEIVFLSSPLWGQSISYIYPAGGKQGTSVEVLLAGQGGINGGVSVWFSGEGVTAKILERSTRGNFLFQSPFGSKSRTIMDDILKDEKKLLPLRNAPRKQEDAREKARAERRKKYAAKPLKENEIPMPEDEEVFRAFPYAHLLEHPSLQDLQLIYYEYFAFQFDRGSNRFFTNTLTLNVTIAPNAKPGPREVRVLTNRGLSRVGYFWVSTSREVKEIEPNEIKIWDGWTKLFSQRAFLSVQNLPIVFNGQIRPGDIDRFYFRAKRSSQLVFDVQSRSLEPFIANAVPGWFAAVVTLYGPDSQKIRYSESYRFDQNPLMFYRTRKAGIYCVEIQDSIFRGRSDFVYRLSIGELPIVYAQSPLGGQVDKPLSIKLIGGNLPESSISVDTSGPVAYDEVRTVWTLGKVGLPRPFCYVVETLPTIDESGRPTAEPEDDEPDPFMSEEMTSSIEDIGRETRTDLATVTPRNKRMAPPVLMPCPGVAYGTISKPGEIDTWQFDAKPGQYVVADVYAQKIGSALDAVVELYDPSGRLVTSNDDRLGSQGPNIGTITHHSDPLIHWELVYNGRYTIRVYNLLNRGGAACFYRLRLSAPQPDFTVCVQPSALVLNGKNANFTVKVFRSEGYRGEIQLAFRDPKPEMTISGNGRIAPGEESKSFTIQLKQKLEVDAMILDIIATGKVGNKEIIHPVLPVDDWEQAFIYHHLVPTQHLYLAQRGKNPAPTQKSARNKDKDKKSTGKDADKTKARNKTRPAGKK